MDLFNISAQVLVSVVFFKVLIQMINYRLLMKRCFIIFSVLQNVQDQAEGNSGEFKNHI